jgi:hypothetical protein
MSAARVRRLVDHVTACQRRSIADALLDASATRWLMRADEFEAARPHVGDYHGGSLLPGDVVMATQFWPCRNGRPLPFDQVQWKPGPPGATREQLRARWDDLTEIANACRAKASVLRELDMPDVLAQVDDVLEESA